MGQNDGSSCFLLPFGYPEQTAVVSEYLCLFSYKFGHYSSLVVIILPNFILRTVEKDILLGGMPVEIQEEEEPVFILLL